MFSERSFFLFEVRTVRLNNPKTIEERQQQVIKIPTECSFHSDQTAKAEGFESITVTTREGVQNRFGTIRQPKLANFSQLEHENSFRQVGRGSYGAALSAIRKMVEGRSNPYRM